MVGQAPVRSQRRGSGGGGGGGTSRLRGWCSKAEAVGPHHSGL